jgi:hypothetical protein
MSKWDIGLLLSYYYHRNDELGAWILQMTRGAGADVLLDSGAFSAKASNVSVDIHSYRRFLHSNKSALLGYFTLDVIGDHVGTESNTRLLEDDGLTPIPCFHIGSPWLVLERMLGRYHYIGLGGMVPYSSNASVLNPWLHKCFDMARHHYGCHRKIYHGLGMTSTGRLRQWPWRSVDSSSVLTGIRYGSTMVYEQRTGKMRAIALHDPRQLRLHAPALRSCGVDPHLFARRASATKQALLQAGGASLRAALADAHARHRSLGYSSPDTRLFVAGNNVDFMHIEEGAQMWLAQHEH